MGANANDQQQSTADEQSTDQGVNDEQSTDQAGEETAGVEEQEGETGEETTEEDAVELIGQKEFDKLKGNPEALRKELNRAATKKFQQLSRERKELEPYRGFIKGLEEDPVAAVTAVARKLGIKIEEAPATQKGTEKVVTTLGDKVTNALRKALGPDYEDIADKLGVGITEALQEAIPELTRESQEKINAIIADSSMREAQTAIQAFEKKHPDWKKHEDAMTELSERMPPGPNMSEAEYLENLYFLVTRERSTGEGVKKIVSRMQSSSRNAEKDSSMSEKNVSKTPVKPPTFKEAFAAAKRGERFE